ncbi:hypothetical protein L6R29_11500 [Myxococcota bacterium]|nr:hypothetical protein [Myxococcota bacterium]
MLQEIRINEQLHHKGDDRFPSVSAFLQSILPWMRQTAEERQFKRQICWFEKRLFVPPIRGQGGKALWRGVG